MPICPLIWQAVMVMPDCSLVVTTFSKQSWPLQRTATRVMSMVSFRNELPIRTMQGLCHDLLRPVLTVLKRKVRLFSQTLAQSGLMSAPRLVCCGTCPSPEPMGHSNNCRVLKTLNALSNGVLERKTS